MKTSFRGNISGFTLIELLVVVLIIGILSAVALPQYQKAVEKTRFTEALVVGRAISDAQNRYRMENGFYAGDVEELDIDIPLLKNFDWSGGELVFSGPMSSTTIFGLVRKGTNKKVTFYIQPTQTKITCWAEEQWCKSVLPCAVVWDVGTSPSDAQGSCII